MSARGSTLRRRVRMQSAAQLPLKAARPHDKVKLYMGRSGGKAA
jgi:hypothetical protein